jgi:hypothetical protein
VVPDDSNIIDRGSTKNRTIKPFSYFIAKYNDTNDNRSYSVSINKSTDCSNTNITSSSFTSDSRDGDVNVLLGYTDTLQGDVYAWYNKKCINLSNSFNNNSNIDIYGVLLYDSSTCDLTNCTTTTNLPSIISGSGTLVNINSCPVSPIVITPNTNNNEDTSYNWTFIILFIIGIIVAIVIIIICIIVIFIVYKKASSSDSNDVQVSNV